MNDAKQILPPHTRVRVRSRYEGSWVDGFEIISSSTSSDPARVTYEVRRMFDGVLLPTEFDQDDIRPS